MLRRRLIAVVVVALAFVLTGLATAAATDPQVALDPVDQSWAESIVLSTADLGRGWRETPTETQEGDSGGDDGASFCPEADSDQSDLVATGGTGSDFTHGSSSVTSFAIVWRTQEFAQAN